ncbi:ABC transporter substrate-binding protein [Hominifimenecus sp. rT4P-3]|uniref:ABC transporter substrate-binding protein n=1 Tax=Hominifimenecus sp. rT4P-3 TaxID=3242979 RepID=UPI003DA339A0
MKKIGKKGMSLLLAMLLLFSVASCSSQEAAGTADETPSQAASAQQAAESTAANLDSKKAEEGNMDAVEAEVGVTDANAPEIPGLTYESTMELLYANEFQVYYYEGGYGLIDVHNGARYLVIPEGMTAPEGLPEDVICLPQPLDHIYLAATSAMALFDAMDALDAIKLTGTVASGWYIDSAVAAMEEGRIQFAGKYSEPDYEMLVDQGCDLAIESTMILHSPKVQEMIEMLDIPVFIDRSSYETHPLGRTEWIKLYSVLVDKEAEAEAFFAEQAKVIGELKDFPNTEKTVAYFYVSTDGSVVVRKVDDYIPKMIELAGGRYSFADLPQMEGGSASVPLTMEEFYATAVNADYLIYNASIDKPIETMDELLAKSGLFADFKAVKEGNVWSTGKSLYQATDTVGHLIRDVHLMLTGGDESEMMFIHKIQ